MDFEGESLIFKDLDTMEDYAKKPNKATKIQVKGGICHTPVDPMMVISQIEGASVHLEEPGKVYGLAVWRGLGQR